MASEPVDLALIHDEELLRRMWQQTEDFGRKKEIRAHMYKLRENRLRDFYTGDMDATIGIGKGLGSSHGDSLQDQSFESFKTKEIRDSESPTRDYKFDVVAPDTSGWNVVTSSEVTNDGKTHTTQSLATTAGVQDITGGKTSFSGRNEQLSSVTHEGDDNNYTTTAGQSSNTLLQETSVIGDENSGRSESKSTSVTSSSRVIKSQHTSSGDQADRDHRTVADDFNEMLQSTRNTSNVQQQSTTNNEKESKISTTAATSKHSTTTEMSAEARQKEVERLAALPGEIISRQIDYPDANTKMITETKALDDGTIVTTRKYETRSASSKVWSSASTKQESSSTHSVTEERAQKQRIECIRNDREIAEKLHETSQQRDRETTQQQSLKNDSTTAAAKEDYAPSEVSQFSPQSNRTFEFTEESTERHEDTSSFQTTENITKKDYRQDHMSKRVSVEVDAAHDAFARSLRSISPDRGSTKSSTTRINTEKNQHSRRSPSRESDMSRISSNTVTKSKSDLTTHDYQRSTISSQSRQVRGSTPTTTKRPTTVVEDTDEPRDRVPVKEPSPVRRPTQTKDTAKPSAKSQPIKDFETDSARSTSPTSTVSDIIYHQGDNRRIVTDLDTEEVTEVSQKSTQQIINTESTSTTIETSVAEGYGDEEVSEKRSKTPTAQPRKNSIKKTTTEDVDSEETSETSKRHKLSRSETYEERCMKILGMSEQAEIQAMGEENLTNILTAIETQQEKTTTTSKAQDTVDFLANEINHEKTTRKMSSPSKKTPASSPERKPSSVKAADTKKEEKPKSPERKTSVKKTTAPQKAEPVRKSSKTEIKRESVTEITQSSKTVTKKEEEKKSNRTLGERKKSTGLESKDTKHVSTAKITISPVASKAKPKDEKPVSKKTKKITHSDYSSEAEDSEKEIPTTEKTPSRRVNKLPVVERKESAPVYSSRQEKESVHKMARSTSENTFRSSARKRSKPDMAEISKSPEKTIKGETKRPTKCITTKTINLTATSHTETAKAEDVDVIVDIQQAKSSREPTPNRIIPVPVSPEEDTGKPRYPDAVHEPDDIRRQPKVKNIPIYEEETSDYIGCSITEVAEEDSTMSVTEKVNLFSTLKESSSSTQEKSFVKESSVDVDEKLENDECLLSVSDKVNKFISTAEEVKKIRTSAPFSPNQDRDDSIRVDEECLLSVTDKVTKFISTAEDVKKPKVSAPFKPESRPENGDLITDESQLSVTEKVTKFRTRAEKLAETAPQRSPELVAKIDKQVSRSKPPTVEKVSEEEFGDIEEEKTRRSSVKDRYTPKEKPVTTSPITLRSTEIVKKAKAVFEQNKSPAKSRDILSRPSVWEGKKSTKLADIGVKKEKTPSQEDTPKTEGFFLTEPGNRDTPRELDRAFQNIEKSSPSDSIPSYLKDAVATRKHIFEKKISSSRLETEKIRRKSQETTERKTSKSAEEIEPVVEEICVKKTAYQTQPVESVGAKRSLFERKDSLPSYMSPTVSSLEHSNTQRKDSIDINKSNLRKASMEKKEEEMTEGNPRSTVKFGVSLKRTDSETSQPRRKSSCPEIPHIEEIFELELLERMLETVVGYEQRRRIRAQIRLVKKEMETKSVRKVSPTRKLSPRKISAKTIETPDNIHHLNGHKEIETIEIQEKHISRSPSPPKSLPNLRQMRQVVTESKDDKPIWATKNILKKASERSESNRSYASRRVVSEVKSRVKTETSTEPKSIDSVTSSYGIGPTDDNGQPLFGLRALKKKTPGSSDSTTKVSGSIIRESYHSLNGADPVGQRSITLYSSDPADFDQIGMERKTPSQIRDKLMESEQSRKVHSVTKTQKIGADEKSPKVVRRGSVKELSEKFIQKEAAIQDKSTTQNYPKAGLILRTQTSREDRRDSDSRSSTLTKSPEKQQGKVVMTKTQTVTGDGGLKTTTTTKETRSFLNSASSKVTDVQDVLDRMRNADNVEEAEDSADDREARALLNKFIGASVLMAGMESMMPQQMSKIVGSPGKQQQQQVVKSTTKSGKTTNSTKKRPTNIDEIWDEVLLKQLLEQTTNYEERRKLRARLKQVMAEKEACADIIASVKRELKEQQELEESDEYEIVEEEEETVEEEEVSVEEEEESVEEEEEEEEEEEQVAEEVKTATTKVAPAPPQVAPVATTKELTAETETTENESKINEDGVITTTKITTKTVQSRVAATNNKPMSPFAKFRQLDKQNSAASPPNSPLTPSTPKTPGGSAAPIFKFTDPALSARAATVKEQLLQWCQIKTKEYENVQITNFSTSWCDGLAFCALIHHFLPDAFDYNALTPQQRKHNFTLAFRVADEKAGIAPLLDVEDMVIMRKPDWKCVFTYVQSIYRRFRNAE